MYMHFLAKNISEIIQINDHLQSYHNFRKEAQKALGIWTLIQQQETRRSIL